jgi:molybdopterin-guanine dinucleotide biosynthesis protein B
VWDWLAGRIADGRENANNRFEIADAVNRMFPGVGPFWGRPDKLALPDLPAKGTLRNGHGMVERRAVERLVPTAQPVWKLYTTGSVGGQALLGLPVLSRLRRLPGVTVWPFEPMGRVVLAEVWPSLLAARVAAEQGSEIKDRVQVRVLARELMGLAAAGRLAPLFDVPEGAREEGWILGVGHEAALRG